MIEALHAGQMILLPEHQEQGLTPPEPCLCKHCGATLKARTTAVNTWHFNHPKTECRYADQVKRPDATTTFLKWQARQRLSHTYAKHRPHIEMDVLWEDPFGWPSDFAMKLSTGEVYAGWVLTVSPKNEELQERIRVFQDAGVELLFVLHHPKEDPADHYRKVLPVMLRNNCLVVIAELEEHTEKHPVKP